MGLFSLPHTTVIKKLPAHMLAGAQQIERTVTSAFPAVDKFDVSFCIVIGIASWLYELEQNGSLDADPRNTAYIYEAARIAAKDIRRKDCIPYLEATLRKMDLKTLAAS